MSSFSLPPDYPRIRVVHSFAELIGTPFENGLNALCWQRTLSGDFGEIITQLGPGAGMTSLDEDTLATLDLTPAGREAADRLLADLRLLSDHGLDPVLDCIHAYPRNEDSDDFPTDVHSFHADSATVETDTYLCTYHGASSEGLRNDQAQPRVEHPPSRAALLQHFGSEDDAAFCEYLSDHCHDLHYLPQPQARPFSFGLGNLWRLACAWPGSPVPPCIHRAPAHHAGLPPRLLLIS